VRKLKLEVMQEEKLIFKNPYNRDVSRDTEQGCNFGHKLTNSNKFRPEAAKFEEFGKYTDLPYNPHASSPYAKYWAREKKRGIEGFHTGDDWIPGYYYFYLNYSPILKVIHKKEDLEKMQQGKQVRGERVASFPNVWDYDYYYFHYLEEAESEGKHASVLKSRGKGYSYKGSSMVRRNFHLIPKSKSFILADNEGFLIKDGIISKSNNIGTFINKHTGFRKLSQAINTKLHVKASYFKGKDKTEFGYESEIIGKTLNNTPDKARGIRGKLILFEEAGEFPGLLKAWQIARESVEQDSVTYGIMIAFGTGGSKMIAYRTLNEFFFKPAAYNIKSIPNIWSENRKDHQPTGFFAPSYSNITAFMDSDGNTDIARAYNLEKSKLEEMEALGTDAKAILQRKSERPLRPEDALLRIDSNDFPVARINDRLADLQTLRTEGDFRRYGRMRLQEGVVIFEDNHSLEPIGTFPHERGGNNTGAIEVWDVPAKLESGEVPDDIYLMGVDPYDQDSSETLSLGSAFVMNRLTGMLVAEYTGRPKTSNEFYEQVMLLAMYYNARVNFENNLIGLKVYFEHRGQLGLLEPSPDIIKKMSKVANEREYGTPGTTKVNQYARDRIKTWLLDRIIDDKLMLQVDQINSIPLLQELASWDAKGNYDRVSSLGMLLILYEGKKGITGIDGYKTPDVYDAGNDPYWDKLIGEEVEEFNMFDLVLKI